MGFAVGFGVGLAVGLGVGVAVGLEVGLGVGVAVGLEVGFEVSVGVGFEVSWILVLSVFTPASLKFWNLVVGVEVGLYPRLFVAAWV